MATSLLFLITFFASYTIDLETFAMDHKHLSNAARNKTKYYKTFLFFTLLCLIPLLPQTRLLRLAILREQDPSYPGSSYQRNATLRNHPQHHLRNLVH